MKKNCILALASFFAVNCSGDLPLSDLINNSVTLKVLGTYESNDPYGNLGLFKDDIIGSNITNAGGSWATGTPQVATYANSLSISSVKYYIDIAEIRLAQGQGKSSSQAISDYWSQFAITRQLMCTDTGTTDASRVLTNCSDQNGPQRLIDFFNGGFTYPAVDLATGNYNHIGMYFRRFNTYPGARFGSSGGFIDASGNSVTQTDSEKAVTATFDNRTVYGLDIESFLQNPYGSTAAEPLMFPLQNKNLSISITNGAEPYVLEVRVFLKNLMMAHVIQASDNTGLVFVAPSDWNVDHKFNDTSYSTFMGGSVLITARTYQPANVGKIQLQGIVSSGSDYFAVVPASSTFPGQAWVDGTSASTAVLPLAATRGTNTAIANLPPGSYDVYRTCDIMKCANTSTAGYCDQRVGTKASPLKDGYPETADKCGTVSVTANTTTSLTVPAACTGSGNCP